MSSNKKSLTEVIRNVKQALIEHYDAISFQIDINCQEILIKQKDVLPEMQRSDLLEVNKAMIDKVKVLFDSNMKQVGSYHQGLEKLNSIFSNVSDLNAFFESDSELPAELAENQPAVQAAEPDNDVVILEEDECKNDAINEESVRELSLTNYCVFISKSKLGANLKIKEKNPIGVLVICDRYLNKNQINYIR